MYFFSGSKKEHFITAVTSCDLCTTSQDYMSGITSIISLIVAPRMHVKTDAAKAGTKT